MIMAEKITRTSITLPEKLLENAVDYAKSIGGNISGIIRVELEKKLKDYVPSSKETPPGGGSHA